MSIVFFYVDSTLQGGNESEVHNHDVSMFDITNINYIIKINDHVRIILQEVSQS